MGTGKPRKPSTSAKAVPFVLLQAAKSVTVNALVRAIQLGKSLTSSVATGKRQPCACTSEKGFHSPNRCPACALLEYRLQPVASDPEAAVAKMLGVDATWVTSLLAGWDNDAKVTAAPEYPAAYRLGRMLRRRYGG